MKIDLTDLKPCPFCGSNNLNYSLKTQGKSYTTHGITYHATIYCKKCHCYGPRVLSQHIHPAPYGYQEVWNDDELLKATKEKWNER